RRVRVGLLRAPLRSREPALVARYRRSSPSAEVRARPRGGGPREDRPRTDGAQRLRIRSVGLPDRLRVPVAADLRAGLPVFFPRPDDRDREPAGGAGPPDRQPRRSDRPRRGDDRGRLPPRGEPAADRPRDGRVLAAALAVLERRDGPDRQRRRYAEEL